ncbi:MAG: DUF3105 domain-containing protein [Chloroflexi bacterium]|nr:DUF3105 domain-containing protein [Chloroflexota bacterium]
MSKRKKRDRGVSPGRSASEHSAPTAVATGKRLAAATAVPVSRQVSRRSRRLVDRLRRPRPVELLLVVAVLVAVAIAIYFVVNSTSSSSAGRPVPIEASSAHVPEGTSSTFASYPPASGQHYGPTRPWGVHREEVPPGYWIHNLEHGGVVILYNCAEGCPELVGQLEDVYKTFPLSKSGGNVKLLIAPDRKIQQKLAIISWGWIDEMDQFDRGRLLRFYQAHLDNAPEELAQ